MVVNDCENDDCDDVPTIDAAGGELDDQALGLEDKSGRTPEAHRELPFPVSP
jgi:hypothetical protein